jgi:hypothetical protein
MCYNLVFEYRILALLSLAKFLLFIIRLLSHQITPLYFKEIKQWKQISESFAELYPTCYGFQRNKSLLQSVIHEQRNQQRNLLSLAKVEKGSPHRGNFLETF